eukprot:COSAG02_NODE_984_length_15467_cov_20.165799_11_plen_74_part_00
MPRSFHPAIWVRIFCWLEVGRVWVSKTGRDVCHNPATKPTTNAPAGCDSTRRRLRRCRWPAWSEDRIFCRSVL